MNILFVTAPEGDYLADSLFIGLRSLLGSSVVDYPRYDALYADFNPKSRARLRGCGFTLYTGLLSSVEVDRFRIDHRLASGEFDLVIFGHIWRSWGLFMQWRQWLSPRNCILLDGEDSPQVYPHAGLWWRKPSRWFVPRATSGFLYYKREWTEDTQFNLWHRVAPRIVRRKLHTYRGLRQIAFSIPEQKIITGNPKKHADFARHIVDPQVAQVISGSSARYAFTSERDYYEDLQASRFGVTMKRAGWDCLRHYEIAANGAVICFRDLETKPTTCAPHGLIPDQNCLSYKTPSELFQKIAQLTLQQYANMRRASLQWAQQNSCRNRATEVLQMWKTYTDSTLSRV